MTPVQIAYFKHFLFDKTIERSYVFYYRKYRVKDSPRGDEDGNPESIEQFFLQTSVKDVVMKAFTFHPTNGNERSNFTYDYWKDIDDKWQEYMKQNESNWTNDSWPQLSKTFAILRQNWDLPLFWKRDYFESTEEVYKRMNINLPLPDYVWPHGAEPRRKKEETAQQEESFTQGETNMSSELIDFVDDDADDLEIDFVEISKNQRFSNGLRSGIISVNTRNHSYKISVNRFDTKAIRSKLVKYVHIGRIKSGDVVIQINNNSKGVQIIYTNDNYYNINSRQFVEKLRSMMDITDDLAYLRIQKIAEKLDSITYKVTKQQ